MRFTAGRRVSLDAPQGVLCRGAADPATCYPIDGGFLVVSNGATGVVVQESPLSVKFDALPGVVIEVPGHWLRT